MLVVTLKETEKDSEGVKIKTSDGDVIVRFIKKQGKNQVRIGFIAPEKIKIDRFKIERK